MNRPKNKRMYHKDTVEFMKYKGSNTARSYTEIGTKNGKLPVFFLVLFLVSANFGVCLL